MIEIRTYGPRGWYIHDIDRYLRQDGKWNAICGETGFWKTKEEAEQFLTDHEKYESIVNYTNNGTNNGWYAYNEGGYYLHKDGVWRKGMFNTTTGEYQYHDTYDSIISLLKSLEEPVAEETKLFEVKYLHCLSSVETYQYFYGKSKYDVYEQIQPKMWENWLVLAISALDQ